MYSLVVSLINLDAIVCPYCNIDHCFHKHAYYPRFVKLDNGKDKSENKLKILRIKCKICGKTHALVPYSIIPYTQRTLDDTIIIFYMLDSDLPFNSDFLLDHSTISAKDFYTLKRTFHIWKKVMASFSSILDAHLYDIFISSFKLTHRNLSQLRYKSTDSIIPT